MEILWEAEILTENIEFPTWREHINYGPEGLKKDDVILTDQTLE